ncbi:hypothetical protein U9M48_012829 [Paspalum notatum var. saurae]|uniref:ATP-dependent DNA helicase n=1 Tax=Paspalum notatum var. saurae TaxID=547442 RepID=A0AAQ3T117_PASNO
MAATAPPRSLALEHRSNATSAPAASAPPRPTRPEDSAPPTPPTRPLLPWPSHERLRPEDSPLPTHPVLIALRPLRRRTRPSHERQRPEDSAPPKSRLRAPDRGRATSAGGRGLRAAEAPRPPRPPRRPRARRGRDTRTGASATTASDSPDAPSASQPPAPETRPAATRHSRGLRALTTQDMGADTQQLRINQTSKAVNIEESVDMATGSDNCSIVEFTNLSTDELVDDLMQSHTINMTPNVIASEHKRQMDIEMSSIFQESSEINKKRREPSTGDVQEDMDPDDNSDWLHQNETYMTKHMKTSEDLLTPSGAHETVCHPSMQNRSRATYYSKWYKNLTPEERESRREYLRLYDKKPSRKEAKREDNRRRRELRANTLNPESIAIENPTYSPEIVHPNSDATEHDRSPVSARDWAIPEMSGTPFFPLQHSPRRSVPLIGDDDEGVVFEEDSDKDEGYLFAGQDDETDEDIEIDRTPDDFATIPEVPDQYDKVYSNIPQETHMLKPVPNCMHCNAVKFEHEPPGFCCRNGKIKLSQQTTSDELVRLWSSADADARHFRDNIRFFNGHFSFTSLYCWLDKMTTNMKDCGIYTFRAHGMLYHNIKSFGREADAEHKHLELYFYDDDPSLEHRYRRCRKERLEKDKEVIDHLVRILRGNPYSEHLRSMGHVKNLDDYHIELNLDQKLDQKTYNTPVTSEVAAVWVEGSERRGQFSKSVMLHGKDRSGHGIRSYHGCYDALSSPLFFPKGELEWHANIPKADITMAEVEEYRVTHRKRDQNDDDEPDSPSHLCVSVCDYYCYKFQMPPDYIRNNQERLRADLYQGLVDSLHAGEARADAVGKRTVLATSFIGGPRDMRHRYMDAMVLVRKYGKPDIFLTMTCNPNWDEIKRELLPWQTPQDRPDLVVRVFHAKLEELKKKLTKEDILGKVRAYVYVVEFQKRGLPHAHFLLIMQNKYKLTCPEQGRRTCKNHYPRPFSDTTLQGKDSYPIYRRRENGRKDPVRGHELDNRWVVPYNPYLLRLFNCHINVEACGSIKAVKYLFKYIYKGHDRASVAVREGNKADSDVDEIKQHRDARWVTPPEALWRIYGFDLSRNSAPVMQLQLHLPNMHMVSFHERQNIKRVVNRPGADRSMLTAYFEANREHKDARGILYRDFPEYYTWQQGKVWQRRKRNTGGQIGRIISAHPAEGERYYLRVLLNHVAGATSFEDLMTVDGELLLTFREVAERRGLLEGDTTHDECLTEAALYQMPSALRRLFATILVYCEPIDVEGLWLKHLEAMSQDYQRSNRSQTHVQQMVLIDIRNMLQSMGKDINTYPLPKIIDGYDDTMGAAREEYEERIIEPTAQDIALKDSLNEEQKAAYDKILATVDTDQGGVFFVDGPGGTGKTYLYKAPLATLRSQDKIAVATATSGVAASIMPGGRTAHSRFKIPLTIDDGAVCSFTKQSGTAKLLQKVSLIIWDEASMTKRQAVEALDNSLRDIMDRPRLPFGGKTMVFGGDFRQSDPWFAEYLLRIGDGTEETNSGGEIRLPDEVCVPYTGSDIDLDGLIDCIFPRLDENMSNTSYITSRAILSTRNDWVDIINMRMIGRFQGDQMVYHSFDSAVDDPHNYYPPEFLNTTRLVVDAEIVLGQHAGKRIFLPRLPLYPSDDEMFPFQFKRKQFPVRLSFAMTVNKVQGQTIPNVGVYLPKSVFSHGQLYVALSRATARSNIKILAIPAIDGDDKKKNENNKKKKQEENSFTISDGIYTKNIVYKEVLTL